MEPQAEIKQREVSWSEAFTVWWAMAWRFMWYDALLTLIVSLGMGIYGGFVHMSPKMSLLYNAMIIIPMALPIQIWVVLIVLRKRIRVGRCRLMLVPEENTL